MTYRAGVYGLERHGIASDDAHIKCDECGVKLYVMSARTAGPPAWLLNGKAPKGWKGGRRENYTRWDVCPSCKDKPGVCSKHKAGEAKEAKP